MTKRKAAESWIIRIGCILCLLLGLACQRQSEDRSERLIVYSAASLTDVLQSIGESFTALHGIKVEFNFASSGALAQQIEANPRADVFISADEVWVDRLIGLGRLETVSRQVFAVNSLCLVANADASSSVSLCSGEFQFIALGDPAYVPVGRYAKAWLESLYCEGQKTSAWQRFEGKVLPASDARAVLHYVLTHRDMLGIVYQTDYLSQKEELRWIQAAPMEEGLTPVYTATSLVSSQKQAASKAFIDFLLETQSQEILATYGFSQAKPQRQDG